MGVGAGREGVRRRTHNVRRRERTDGRTARVRARAYTYIEGGAQGMDIGFTPRGLIYILGKRGTTYEFDGRKDGRNDEWS